MDQSNHIVFVEVSRPGSDSEIARADAAVADVLRAFAWEFEGTHDVRRTVFALAMIVFSGATDAQIADYLRDHDQRARATSADRSSEEDYAKTARAVRIAFGAPAA